MKNAIKYIKSILLIFLTFSMSVTSVACSSDSPAEDPNTPVPDNWITVATAQQNFTYEGGSVQLDATLASGVSASQIEISYTGDGGDWLTATLGNAKLTIACEHSYIEKERMSLSLIHI